jgi:peptidoglycan/LPS O-acetylase OafA/YrhL
MDIGVYNSVNSHRLDLDLLRAIAVAVVVLYHAGFTTFEYGYLGVDIFFVLSGFLIGKSSSKIMDRKSLFVFFKRRFLRIVPSATLVLLFIILVAQFLFYPNDIKRVSTSIVASFFQQANLIFYLKADYFSFNNIYDPLIHFWSLGVEWSFYILIAVVYFLSKKPILILSGLFGASVIIYGIGTELFPNFTFYMFPGRLWEFLLPALFAHRFEGRLNSTRYAMSPLVFSFPFLCLALALFYPSSFVIDGLRLVIAVVASALIVSMNRNPQTPNRGYKIASFIAKISFSWYLVHQPLFAFLNYRYDLMSHYPIKFLAVLVSLVLASCLYFFWERRFFDNAMKVGSLRGGLFVISLLIVPIISILNYTSFEFRSKLTDQNLSAAENLSLQQISFGECHFSQPPDHEDYEQIRDCAAESSAPIYIVFGDSHAVDVFRSLSSALYDETIVNFARGGCRLGSSGGCTFIEMERFVSDMEAWETVVIYHQSGMYLFDSDRGVVDRNLLFKGDLDIAVNKLEIDTLLKNLAQFPIEKVYFLAPWVDPFINPRQLLAHVPECDNYNGGMRYLDDYIALDSYLEAESNNYPKIFYRNISEVFGDHGDNYLISCSHAVHWRDLDHMSWSGMRFFAERIKNSLN